MQVGSAGFEENDAFDSLIETGIGEQPSASVGLLGGESEMSMGIVIDDAVDLPIAKIAQTVEENDGMFGDIDGGWTHVGLRRKIPPARFEPATSALGKLRSIQLIYGGELDSCDSTLPGAGVTRSVDAGFDPFA